MILHKKAVTLIEILIVVAVISIIMAAAAPIMKFEATETEQAYMEKTIKELLNAAMTAAMSGQPLTKCKLEFSGNQVKTPVPESKVLYNLPGTSTFTPNCSITYNFKGQYKLDGANELKVDNKAIALPGTKKP